MSNANVEKQLEEEKALNVYSIGLIDGIEVCLLKLAEIGLIQPSLVSLLHFAMTTPAVSEDPATRNKIEELFFCSKYSKGEAYVKEISSDNG